MNDIRRERMHAHIRASMSNLHAYRVRIPTSVASKIGDLEMYVVPSRTFPGQAHTVRVVNHDGCPMVITCECEHIRFGGRICTHIALVERELIQRGLMMDPVTEPEAIAPLTSISMIDGSMDALDLPPEWR